MRLLIKYLILSMRLLKCLLVLDCGRFLKYFFLRSRRLFVYLSLLSYWWLVKYLMLYCRRSL